MVKQKFKKNMLQKWWKDSRWLIDFLKCQIHFDEAIFGENGACYVYVTASFDFRPHLNKAGLI